MRKWRCQLWAMLMHLNSWVCLQKIQKQPSRKRWVLSAMLRVGKTGHLNRTSQSVYVFGHLNTWCVCVCVVPGAEKEKIKGQTRCMSYGSECGVCLSWNSLKAADGCWKYWACMFSPPQLIEVSEAVPVPDPRAVASTHKPTFSKSLWEIQGTI